MAVTQLDANDLAARATAAVGDRFPGATIADVQQLVGGTSSLTYLADLHLAAADDAREVLRAVIKVAPPGLEPVRNRDVLRQARLFDVLHDGQAAELSARVPEVYGTSVGAPPEVPPLFVMSFIAGESYEPVLTPADSAASASEIGSRAFAAARLAGALHAVDVTDPRLAGERITDLTAEVERWARAFGSVDDDLQAGHEPVRDALLLAVPGSLPPSVLHGDFRLGNMQCSGGSVDALIDWEIWSLGDRRLDLAWFLLNTDPGHPNARRTETGLPEPGALIAIYEASTGVRIDGLGWFDALVRYKQAAASALIIKNNRKLPQPGVNIESMLAGRGRLLDSAMVHLS